MRTCPLPFVLDLALFDDFLCCLQFPTLVCYHLPVIDGKSTPFLSLLHATAIMVGKYQSSHRSYGNRTAHGSSYSFLDRAGDAARDYLRGQARTDLPFKLSSYRPDGEETEPLLTRILTDYDVRRAIRNRPCHSTYTDRDVGSCFVTESLCSRILSLSGLGSTHNLTGALDPRRRITGFDLGKA